MKHYTNFDEEPKFQVRYANHKHIRKGAYLRGVCKRKAEQQLNGKVRNKNEELFQNWKAKQNTDRVDDGLLQKIFDAFDEEDKAD